MPPKGKTGVQIAEPVVRARESKSKTRKGKTKKRKRGGSRDRVVPGPPTEFAQFLRQEQEQYLRRLVKVLVEPGKGILDLGSQELLASRFDNVRLTYGDDTLMQYLGIYLGAGKQLSFSISGLLMDEEMSALKNGKGKKFVLALNDINLKVGIKVGGSRVSMSGTLEETTTEGLDDLQATCARVKDQLGAEFTSWTAVLRTDALDTPSRLAMIENANTLARYAVISQQEGLVPIVCAVVEHSTLDTGLEVAKEVTKDVLACLVKALQDHHVYLEGTILQLSFVGFDVPNPDNTDFRRAASELLKALNACLPPAVGGVLMADNGSPLPVMVTSLNKVNKVPGCRPYPINFCFGQGLHWDVVEKWAGQSKNIASIQDTLVKRSKLCSIATMGQVPDPFKSVFISNSSVY